MQDPVRYQVFVSSTFDDLVEERRAVVQALLKLNCIPAGMELFPASDDDVWSLIKREIDNSDYYVVISAGRYGSIDRKSRLSYTEKEYNYAVRCRKHVLRFIRKDVGKLPTNKRDRDPKLVARLTAFHQKLRRKPVNFWGDRHELEMSVITSCVSRVSLASS